MQSFFELVPHDLIADILSWTNPSTSLAAASRSIRDLLDGTTPSGDDAAGEGNTGACNPKASSPRLRRAWLHRLVFHGLVQPKDFSAALEHRNPSERFAGRHNHRISHFSLVLRRLRPAVHWFPSPPTQCKAFGEYLVYDGRPTRYPRHAQVQSHRWWTLSFLLDQDFVDQLAKRLVQQRRQGKLQASLAKIAPAESLAHSPLTWQHGKETWDPILDLIHVAVFFLRSTNHKMLSYTLAQIARYVPELLSMRLPLSHWSWFCLDYDLIHHWQQCRFRVFRPVIGSVEETRSSFAHYLAITAATQWSVPLLEVVCSNLNLAPSELVAWPHFSTHVLSPMQLSLAHLSCFARPFPVLQWLQRHRIADSPTTLANRARHYGHFVDLFETWDCASSDRIWRVQNEHARTIVALSFRQDLSDLLRRCQQRRILGEYEYGKLLFGFVRHLPHFDRYDPIVKSGIAALDTPGFAFVVATKCAAAFQCFTQATADQLIDLMISLNIDPTWFLLTYGKTWNVYYVSPFLLSTNLLVPVDKTRLLHQVLDWLVRPSTGPIDIIGKHRLVAGLIDEVVATSATDSTPRLDPSPFCPIRLAIIIVCKLLAILRASIPSILPLPGDPRNSLPYFIQAFRQLTSRLNAKHPSFRAHLSRVFVHVIRTNIPGQFLGRAFVRGRPSNKIYPRVGDFACDLRNVEWVIRCLLNDLDPALVLGMAKWNKYTSDCLWKRALATPGTLTKTNLSAKAFAGYLRRAIKAGELRGDSVQALCANVPTQVLQSRDVTEVLRQASGS